MHTYILSSRDRIGLVVGGYSNTSWAYFGSYGYNNYSGSQHNASNTFLFVRFMKHIIPFIVEEFEDNQVTVHASLLVEVVVCTADLRLKEIEIKYQETRSE